MANNGSLKTVLIVTVIFVMTFYSGITYNRITQNVPSQVLPEDTPRQQPSVDIAISKIEGYFSTDTKQAVHTQAFEPLAFTIQRNESFDFKAAMKKLNEANVSQDDPRLIELIRNYYIVPPSTEPYNLTEEKLDYSMGQAPIVDSTLKFMEGGFYVECGACDGEWGTNSLFFEKVRKWNGVLIEADPYNFQKLLKKHRKAFMINACLSSIPHPTMVTFNPGFNVGRIDDSGRGKLEVQSFPLYSILLALNQLRVDFLSLDVEGVEIEVLKNIPFKKVDIKMMAVEYNHVPGGAKALAAFGRTLGYDPMLQIQKYNGRAEDIIFKKMNVIALKC